MVIIMTKLLGKPSKMNHSASRLIENRRSCSDTASLSKPMKMDCF